VRKIHSEQVQMGEIAIEDIKINLDCRDEIPQLLLGLQHLYSNSVIRKKVFNLLWDIVPQGIDINNGRKGMNLWSILVLGTLRLNCNWDYDKLQEIANNHFVLRQMLGHGILNFEFLYSRQTLNDNLRLFTSDILDKINQIVVEAGVKLIGDGNSKPTHSRCDSFVVETNVHFPTDLNLLWDAVRKAMSLSFKMTEIFNIDGWRQTVHNIRTIKKMFRAAQKERTRDKDDGECASGNHAIQQYINTAMMHLSRAKDVADSINTDVVYGATGKEIRRFVEHGIRQIDQISRRCFNGEVIPHNEKVFSVFEEHTEWISKGKAGVSQELGLRVCIVESSSGFILHHRVMEKQTDDAIAVPIIKDTLSRFPYIKSCSFDKGFHSPQNQSDLSEILDLNVLPRKGKLNEENKNIESSDNFMEKRRQHSAVESAINAIENHGLDRCSDRGLDGFKRYIALAIVGRNIQLIGAMLRNKELAKREKMKKRMA